MEPDELAKLLAERERSMALQLKRAIAGLARTDRALAERGPAPIPGDILFTPGSSEPECLVLEAGEEPDSWWVVTLDAASGGVVVDDDVAGTISVAVGTRARTTTSALAGMRRSGVVSAQTLTSLHVRLGGVERVQPPTSRSRWPWALAAAIVVAGLATLLLRSEGREHPGLYRLRGAANGEVGAELRVDDRICRASGILESGPCLVEGGRTISVEYRLDAGMEHRHAVILERSEGASASRVAFVTEAWNPLEASVVAGEERCQRGFCLLTTLPALAGEIWVVFLRVPVEVDRLPEGPPSGWMGAVPYRFTVKRP